VLKFLRTSFKAYAAYDRDKEPHKREQLLNEISIYLLSNADLVAEYFFLFKDNVIVNYVNLINFLFKTGAIKNYEKIDKNLIVSALSRSLRAVLKFAQTTNSGPKDPTSYMEDKEVSKLIYEIQYSISLLENL